jgi:AraC-like DNA-binding protein
VGIYRETPPVPSLRDHLACVWSETVPRDASPERKRILPDACIDIVWTAGEAPRLAGPDTGPVLAEMAPGTTIVGARFRPGLAPDVLRVSAAELRDAQPELAAIWGGRCVRRLAESDASDSIEAMAVELQREIAGRLGEAGRDDPLVPAALAWAARRGPDALTGLTSALDVGERQLRRRVEERFGYGPTTLRRVLRLQRLLALTARHPWSLAELADAAGYADQAHMTRECRRLSGLTPARLLPEWRSS